LSSSRPIDRFTDIIDNIDAITSYTKGMTRDLFMADNWRPINLGTTYAAWGTGFATSILVF
jgi:hypothetical protein